MFPFYRLVSRKTRSGLIGDARPDVVFQLRLYTRGGELESGVDCGAVGFSLFLLSAEDRG